MNKIINILLLLLVVHSTVAAKDLLLVDVSGSTKSKAQEVRIVVQKYIETGGKVLAFSDNVFEIKHADDLIFNGNTNLSLALEKVKSLNIDYLTIVSDGLPMDEDKSIKIAKELKNSAVTICGIFISDSLVVPTTFKIIANQTYAFSEYSKAIAHCADMKFELMGKQAKQKSVDINKYTF